MQFTEHEMTTALQKTAKAFLTRAAADIPAVPEAVEQTADDLWQAMSAWDRYQMLTNLEIFILPVFAALPEVDVEPGQRAQFTAEQILAAAEQTTRANHEAGKVHDLMVENLTARRAEISTVALDCLPVKAHPAATDEETIAGFVIPDSLEGL